MADRRDEHRPNRERSGSANAHRAPSRKKRKNKKKKIILISVFTVIILLIIGIFVYGYMIFNGLTFADLTSDLNKLGFVDGVTEKEGVTNVALFGVDSRNEKKSRSDTIIIVTIDHTNNKIKLSSVMRDSYVKVDGYMNKINSAYFSGGPEGAIRCLNSNFGLDIKEYATVDFGNMAQIIDAFGGVDIEVSDAELPVLNQCVREQAALTGKEATPLEKSGLVHLNGIQAVGYARIRSVGKYDYERTDRQRHVLEKLFEKALTASKWEYPEMLRKLLPMVETSMGFNQILGEAMIVLNSPTFYEMRFPMDKDLTGNSGRLVINGVEYVSLNIKKTSEHLKQYIYHDIDPALVLDEITETYTVGR